MFGYITASKLWYTDDTLQWEYMLSMDVLVMSDDIDEIIEN